MGWKAEVFHVKRFLGFAVVLMALAVPAAHASLMVNIGGTVSGGVLTGGTNYTDNQVAVDTNPSLGVMDIGTFLDSISVNFVIQGFTATSGSPVGSLSMNSNADLASSAPLPLGVNISITDTGYTDPIGSLVMTQTVNLLSSVGGIAGNATADAFFGKSDTPFDVSAPLTAEGIAAILAGVGTNTVGVGDASGPSPYSLTTVIHLDITGRGSDPVQNLQLNANLASNATPEPGTWTLLAIGLGFCGLGYRRRRT